MLEWMWKRVGHGREGAVGVEEGKEEEKWKSLYQIGWYVTKFLTNSCMFTYE